MKITFSVPVRQLEEQYDRILAELSLTLPDVRVEADRSSGLLTLDLPPNADPVAVLETLRLSFAKLGIDAKRIQSQEQAYYGSYAQNVPPVHLGGKQPRTVRLSVFVISLICVALAVSVLMFSIGMLFGDISWLFGSDGTLGTGEQEGESYAGKIALIDSIFEEYALYDTDGQLLLDEMLKAYVAATGDKYAAYYTAEELEALMAEMEGEAVGVGVTVTLDVETGTILVIQVAPDSPAAKADVKPGDRIVAIGTKAEGERVADIGYEIALKKLQGEVGTVAEFVVLRGEEEIEFSITRAAFTAVSAQGWVSTTNAEVGILRISSFEANTPAQFKTAMNELIEKGCTRFVFDVRNNPGGEQKSVSAILSYFANEDDVILSTVSKDGTTTYYRAEEATYTGDYAACSVAKEEIGMYRDYPMVVVTNGYTASAGELFTAALSDYGLATLVGENTYGKGVIQSIFDLSSMGYSGGLKLTVGYYAPPSGENYDGKGIAPDVTVVLEEALANKSLYLLSESEDNQLSAAIAQVMK